MGKLLPALVETVVSISAGIAFDAAANLVTPANTRAIQKFAIKGGASIVGAFLAAKLASIATASTNAVLETVSPEPVAEIEAATSVEK